MTQRFYFWFKGRDVWPKIRQGEIGVARVLRLVQARQRLQLRDPASFGQRQRLWRVQLRHRHQGPVLRHRAGSEPWGPQRDDSAELQTEAANQKSRSGQRRSGRSKVKKEKLFLFQIKKLGDGSYGFLPFIRFWRRGSSLLPIYVWTNKKGTIF